MWWSLTTAALASFIMPLYTMHCYQCEFILQAWCCGVCLRLHEHSHLVQCCTNCNCMWTQRQNIMYVFNLWESNDYICMEAFTTDFFFFEIVVIGWFSGFVGEGKLIMRRCWVGMVLRRAKVDRSTGRWQRQRKRHIMGCMWGWTPQKEKETCTDCFD